MDDCPRCGATRTDEPGWCGQCYAPHRVSRAPEMQALVVMNGSGNGQLSFPVWMRLLMTAAVVGGGVLLVVGFGPWWDAAQALWALGVMLLVTYATLCGVMVARLWTASDRREERLVLLDRAKIDEVERRQRALRAARQTA